MRFALKEIADLIGATIDGDSDIVITDLSKIEMGGPGTITFLANLKYLPFVYTTTASAIIVPKDFTPEEKVSSTLLKVSDPYNAFTLLLEKMQENIKNKRGIESPSWISETARIGENPYVGAFAHVGNNTRIGNNVKIYPNSVIGDNVVIGDNTVIHPNVSIGFGCRVGSDCIIHSGTVIGSDGFGYAPQKNGYMKKIPQIGIVSIMNDVEIGAGCTIDRATLGETVIESGVRIDNLVQIAHNVRVGENTAIAAQAGISGSTVIGKSCMIGGQVGIVGHIILADNTRIGAQSGVSKSVKTPGRVLRGSPAQEIKKQLKDEALIRQLEEMTKKLAYLEARLSEGKE